MELTVAEVLPAPKVRTAPGRLRQMGDLGEDSHP